MIDDEKKELIADVKHFFNQIIYKKYNKSANRQEEAYIRDKVNLI